MTNSDIAASYLLLEELFINPSMRDGERISTLLEVAKSYIPKVAKHIERFMETDSANSSNEYVSTLELSPPCPLYLGSHLFEEPTTCSGISTSPRNAFMLELIGMYEHFGFDLGSFEMPDFLPVMLDFLALSLDDSKTDTLGLRRRMIEKYLLPGLTQLTKGFEKVGSVYGLLVPAIELVAAEDLQRMGDKPIWKTPDEKAGKVSLHVVPTHRPALSTSDVEVRP